MMEDITKRLRDAAPTITKICELSGAAGASVGVLHQDEVVYTAGFGYRDIATKTPPDENTIYHLASLSKAFTGAALSMLVHDENLDWETPVSKILPQFTHYDEKVQNEASLLDMVAHRTCLAHKSALWLQDWTYLLLGKEELFPTISYTELAHPFRSQWFYSNWGYCIAAEILERRTGKTWAELLAERLFGPLGLDRTSTERFPKGNNVAKAYQALPNGSSSPVEPPELGAGTIMQGATGVTSCVADLLSFYKALLRAWKHETNSNSSSTPDLPFKDVRNAVRGHIALEKDSKFQQTYGIGWAVSELPAPLGQIGTNPMFVSEMPIVGKGSKKRLIWHHNGSLVGFFSSVHILPDSDTAIIVLTNSMANNDCADWIGQLLVETVIDNPDKNDYLKLAQTSVAGYNSKWKEVHTTLAEQRVPNTDHRPWREYSGKFFNEIRNFLLHVNVVRDGLELRFQGLTSETHKLQHYHYNTFSWELTAEESIARGRWPDLEARVYLLHFETDEDGRMNRVRWDHDWAIASGEIFVRDVEIPKSEGQCVL